MRKLMTLLTILLALQMVHTAKAQSLDTFKRQLRSGSTSSQISITEYGDAASAVERASRGNSRTRVRGYRVCIFFDNGQNARAGAAEAETLFQTNFPGVKTYKVYGSPYFRVSVGNCLTSEEAIILKGKMSALFPKAFLKSEEFALAELLN